MKWLWYVFSLLDVVLTLIGIHRYGLVAEGNPIMRWAFRHSLLGAAYADWGVSFSIGFTLDRLKAFRTLTFLTGARFAIVFTWICGLLF